MLMVIGGTGDSREILCQLEKNKVPYVVTTATAYGGDLAKDCGGGRVITGPLTAWDMVQLIREAGATRIVDASHPFALEVSQNARRAAWETGVKYLRFQRPPAVLPGHPLIHYVPDFPAAARKAFSLGNVVFLAVGSKNLAAFTGLRAKGQRVAARVLPLPTSLAACREAGIPPGDIIALQDTSKEVTAALLKAMGARVLVTKDSGRLGGTPDKVAAALSLEIPVVVVRQPPREEGETVECIEDVLAFARGKEAGSG